MRTKITYLLTLLALSSSAYAANSGFYVGVDAGRDTGVIKSNGAFVDGKHDLEHVNDTTDPAVSNFLWGAHAGYSLFLTKQFVMGAETFWNRSNATYRRSDGDAQVLAKFEVNNSIGISMLPGWQLDSNNRLYARLGWIQTQFTQDGNYPRPAFQQRLNGLEVGLGYLATLTNQWDMRMEYDHDNYEALHRSIGADNFSSQPQLDRYTLGVDYNFDANQIKLSDTIMLPISGWYTGIDAGRNEASIDKIVYFNQGGSIQEQLSFRGYIGGVHVGYDWQLAQHMLLGLEAFGDANSSVKNYNVVIDPSHQLVKTRERSSVGVSLLPGYQFNQANLIYARLGYIASKFTQDTLVNVNSITDVNFSTTKPGLQIGLGYAVAINNNWNVFGEYDYAKYSSIHAIATDTTQVHTLDPEDNQYKFGVNYHF